MCLIYGQDGVRGLVTGQNGGSMKTTSFLNAGFEFHSRTNATGRDIGLVLRTGIVTQVNKSFL